MPQNREFSDRLVTVQCVRCSATFECIGDSEAHLEGLCNRCWARAIEEGKTVL